MILGVLSVGKEAHQLKQDLLEASTRVFQGAKDIVPRIWVDRHLGLCWTPRQIDTFDEFCQPSFSVDHKTVVMCEGKIHNKMMSQVMRDLSPSDLGAGTLKCVISRNIFH
jgi:hypothetical protein